MKETYGNQLCLRVSLDHYTKESHEAERGPKSFDPALKNIQWLYENGFNLSIAGRSLVDEDIEEARQGYKGLLDGLGVQVNLADKLVVFPEMGAAKDTPEITTECWGILNVSPDDQMCASERMIVKRKGQSQPVVLPCTLLAYDEQFELGESLEDSKKDVYLNHPFCSQFCVLGGASCSSTK